MAYSTVPFLLYQIVINAVFRVKIAVYIQLANVMEQVKVKVFNPAFLKLLFKDLLYLGEVCKIIAREFACKVKFIPREFGEHPAHNGL